MKQRALMVLCVLFGAGLVMMCDSDAVQDMVDGEEAQAAGASFTLFQCPDGTRLVESITEGTENYYAGCVQPPTFRLHGPWVQVSRIDSPHRNWSGACFWEGNRLWYTESESGVATAVSAGYDCSTCVEGGDECFPGE